MRHQPRPTAAVDVWVAEPVDDVLGPWLHLLDAAERARAATLPVRQASRFVQARALLRGVLGARLRCPAADVTLQVVCPGCGGEHGPVLLAGGAGPFLSVTRAGPLIAVAVTDHGPVGVDVESYAAVAAAPLAGIGLAVTGHRHLRRAADPRAPARAWVSTEAALKAAGTGLRTDPADVEIRSRHGRRTAVTTDGRRAALVDLDLGPGLAGAVAVAGPRTDQQPGKGRAPRIVVRLLDGDAVLAALGGR